MSDPRRGEVWWGEIADVGRRPFLVMTRSAAIPVLNNVLAAPVTRNRLDEPDLPEEMGLARLDLVELRIAIARRAAL